MKIFLSTHGTMASGMLSAIQMLFGNPEELTVYDAYVNPDDYMERHIEAFLNSCSENETKLLVSDMFGGSVNHDMLQYISYPNTYIVTGVNLSLLLEFLVHKDDDMSEEKIDEIIEKARKTMRRMTPPTMPVEDQDLFD